MATKTISIELDAYDKLVKARIHPRESFTNVIRREVETEGRARDVLARIVAGDFPRSSDPRDAVDELAVLDRSFIEQERN